MRAVKRHPLQVGFMAALLTAGAAAAAPAALASGQVPFDGIFADRFVVTPCPILCATATGSGHASHLGRASEVAHGTLDPATFDPATGCAPDSTTSTLTAANGDRLFLITAAQFCSTSPSTATESGSYHITGGTGRFTGASGAGSYSAQVIFTSPTGGDTIKTYRGTLSRLDNDGTERRAN